MRSPNNRHCLDSLLATARRKPPFAGFEFDAGVQRCVAVVGKLVELDDFGGKRLAARRAAAFTDDVDLVEGFPAVDELLVLVVHSLAIGLERRMGRC